uniref:C2H2-type domain-containing protein n=1 Tax=Globodera rostochiensis TaxID=31243 RepID=A0A914GXP7_GLORO
MAKERINKTSVGKRHKCPNCPKTFAYQSWLEAHKRFHTGERPFECQQCKKRFYTSWDRKVHLQHLHTHSGVKAFKCANCDKRFGQSGALKTHSRTHSGEKPYKCTICLRRFRQSSGLQAHSRVHSGEKPFKCAHCHRAFRQRAHLKFHSRRLHSKDDELPPDSEIIKVAIVRHATRENAKRREREVSPPVVCMRGKGSDVEGSHSQIYRHNTRRRMLESDVLGGQNQSVSAGISPGWNDPPPLNATTTTALSGGGVGGGRLHLQRQRRPVDPSVQSAANFVQLGGSASPGANLQPPASSQHQQQHFHQSRSFPQLHAAAVSASPLPAGPQPPPSHSLGIGTHPASAFSPTSAAAAAVVAAPMIVHSQSQTMLSTGDGSSTGGLTATTTTSFPAIQPPQTLASCAAAAVAATNAQMSLRLNHHLFSPPAPSMGVNLPHPGAAEPLVQQQQHHIQTTTAQSPILAQLAPSEMAQQNALSPHQSLGLSNGHHQPILFAPPNTVPIATDHHNHHNQSAVILRGGVDLNRIPVKAAGDVSLNGLQLVVFLNKATLLLQPGPTREGIQLRFNQFGDLVQACQISEACLKKLNFVVDAIDRHVYDEAWQFFEQMVASFHNDCTIGGWAHGVRLLLQELRKHSSSHAPGRSHSAGTRLTH